MQKLTVSSDLKSYVFIKCFNKKHNNIPVSIATLFGWVSSISYLIKYYDYKSLIKYVYIAMPKHLFRHPLEKFRLLGKLAKFFIVSA